MSLVIMVAGSRSTNGAETDYSQTIASLDEVIEREFDRKMIAGVSVALVDGQRTVLAKGFGWADEERRVPAGSGTIYRIGSLSKLFTAVAAMQLVEQHKLDLDTPIEQLLPGFRVEVPFDNAAPITLREFMCHRSGMVREAPVGGYFDYTEPSLEDTVASIAACALVNPPNTKTRYSNVGPSIVGLTVAHAAGQSFPEYQQQHVLGPMGMNRSVWRMNERLRKYLATGYMRVYDGHGGFTRRPAPQFELGTIPAGNLYSTADDLAKFAKTLLADGRTPSGPLVSPATLQTMWTPQLTKDRAGFGLGFAVGEFAGHKTVRHNGAVYGYTTSIVVVPEADLAVIVLTNEDIAMGSVSRIATAALEGMLEAKLGQKPEPKPAPVEIDSASLARLVGDYESSSYWAEIRVVDGRLVATISNDRMELEPLGPLKFEANSLHNGRMPVEFTCDEQGRAIRFTALEQTFTRIEPGSRRPIPDAWRAYLGAYGPDYIPLVVSERNGRLYAMAENVMDYRLTPVNRSVFRLPAGLYEDEHIVFHVDQTGAAWCVDMANMILPRRESAPATTTTKHP